MRFLLDASWAVGVVKTAGGEVVPASTVLASVRNRSFLGFVDQDGNICVHPESFNIIRDICQEKGWQWHQIQGQSVTEDTGSETRLSSETLNRVQAVLDEMRIEVSEVQRRIQAAFRRYPILEPEEVQTELRVDEHGRLRSVSVPNVRSAAQSNRMEKLRKAEEQARQRILITSVEPRVVDAVTDRLISQSGRIERGLRDKISVLAAAFDEKQKEFKMAVSAYFSAKFVLDELNKLKSEKVDDPQEKRQRARQFRRIAELFAGSPDSYEQAFQAGVDSFIAQIPPLNGIKREVDKTIHSMISISAAISKEKEALAKATADRRAVIRKDVETQLQEIASFPFIERIGFCNSWLEFDTTEARIRYNGMIYPLGRFRICISLSSSSTADIHLVNLDHQNTSYTHPHVTDSGESVCWGDIKEGVYKLWADWNWTVLIQVIWNFLNSYNDDDRFTSVESLAERWGVKPIKEESDGVSQTG